MGKSVNRRKFAQRKRCLSGRALGETLAGATWHSSMAEIPIMRSGGRATLSPETDNRNRWSYSKPHPMDAWELPEDERQEPAPSMNQGVSTPAIPLHPEPAPFEMPRP